MTKDEQIALLEKQVKEKDDIITMLERQMMLAFKEIEGLEDKLAKKWSKKKTPPKAKRRVLGLGESRNWDQDFPVHGRPGRVVLNR